MSKFFQNNTDGQDIQPNRFRKYLPYALAAASLCIGASILRNDEVISTRIVEIRPVCGDGRLDKHPRYLGAEVVDGQIMADLEIINILASKGISARQNIQIRARGYPERCPRDEPIGEVRTPPVVQPRVTSPRTREPTPFGRLREVPSGLNMQATPPIRYRSQDVANAVRGIRLVRQTR